MGAEHAATTSETIRYGIIGTGMMGCEHILNITLTPGAEVVAIADSNETSRGWGRSLAGAQVEVYADHRELLRKARVDAVVIATPNFTHFEILQDVFRTRVHVLVEKPLCTEVTHCRDLIAAARRHAGIVWVGMEYRYLPAVSQLVTEIRRGTIGRLRMCAIREHRFPFLPKVDHWNRFNRNTGGTLVEKCCHFFDLMLLMTARRPTRVYASGAQDVNHLDERYAGETPDIIDNAYAVVDFDGGARALLDLCMFAENSRHEVEIAATGDRGKVEAFVPDHTLVVCQRHGAPPTTVTFELDPALQGAGAHHGSTFREHLAFQQAIRTAGQSVVTVEDGAWAVAVGAAAEQSIREKRPVELSEMDFY